MWYVSVFEYVCVIMWVGMRLTVIRTYVCMYVCMYMCVCVCAMCTDICICLCAMYTICNSVSMYLCSVAPLIICT